MKPNNAINTDVDTHWLAGTAGYEETVRQLQLKLKRCHLSNAEHAVRDLAAAQRHEGATVSTPNNAMQRTCEDARPDGWRYVGKSPSNHCHGSE